MEMTDLEIISNWNRKIYTASRQLEILADLNAVSKRKMAKKLIELGAKGVPSEDGQCLATPGRKKLLGSEQAELIRELYDAGADDGEIGKKLGVSATTIRRWRHEKGWLPQKTVLAQKRMAAKEDAKRAAKEKKVFDAAAAMELYDAGADDMAIAAELKTSNNQVVSWRRGCGLPTQWVKKRDAEAAKAREKRAMEKCAAKEKKRNEMLPIGKSQWGDMPIKEFIGLLTGFKKQYPMAGCRIDGKKIKNVAMTVIYDEDRNVVDAYVDLRRT